MPYARRYKRRTGYRRRPYRRRRSVPPAVRPKKTVRRVVRKNYLTNKRQSSQIRTLFRLRYGSVQMNYHALNNAFTPSVNRPCLIQLKDFSGFQQSGTGQSVQGCQVMQVTSTGFSIAPAARYQVAQNNNPFFSCNRDFPDTGKYLIYGAKYRFRMSGVGRCVDTRVTFHLCKQRAGWFKRQNALPGYTGYQQTQLPFCLVNMTQLTGGLNNMINPYFIKVLATKTVYFNSETDETTQSTQTTANVKYLSFYLGRDTKPIYQDRTAPETPGFIQDTENPPGQSPTDSHWSAGVSTTDVRQGLFLIISCSSRAETGQTGSINVTSDRMIRWADHNGSAAIY